LFPLPLRLNESIGFIYNDRFVYLKLISANKFFVEMEKQSLMIDANTCPSVATYDNELELFENGVH
jgi:hypothetical protein